MSPSLSGWSVDPCVAIGSFAFAAFAFAAFLAASERWAGVMFSARAFRLAARPTFFGSTMCITVFQFRCLHYGILYAEINILRTKNLESVQGQRPAARDTLGQLDTSPNDATEDANLYTVFERNVRVFRVEDRAIHFP